MIDQPFDSDIAAAAKIKPGTWAIIVILIVTLSGWGINTLANNNQIAEVEAALKGKLDKEDHDRDLKAILDAVKELHEDVRELRRETRRMQVKELPHDRNKDID